MVNVQNQMMNRSNWQIKCISSIGLKQCMAGHRKHKWRIYNKINSNISTLVRFNVPIFVFHVCMSSYHVDIHYILWGHDCKYFRITAGKYKNVMPDNTCELMLTYMRINTGICYSINVLCDQPY